MTHICVSKHTIIGSVWLVAWSAPSHYLNQCWNIVHWNLGNKLQWNFNRYSNLFIPENGFESVVCEMAAILSQPQCVNSLGLSDVYKCVVNRAVKNKTLRVILHDYVESFEITRDRCAITHKLDPCHDWLVSLRVCLIGILIGRFTFTRNRSGLRVVGWDYA